MTRLAIAVVMLAAGVLAPAAVRADEPVTASAGDKGFALRSADGAFEFRLRGLLQVDARFFADDEQAFKDTFVLRRLEPSFEFTLGQRAYVKLQPQFAGDTATTSDVFGELRFTPAATLRFGKFKTPLALEYLQSSSALAFVERGLPTEAGAGRDFGVQLHGTLPAGVSYAIAWLNGAPDGRDAANSDTDNHKEVAARVFFEPLRGLGLGLAATRGTKQGAIASSATATTATFNNTLPRYRSPGQNTIFTYLGSTTAPTAANTVIAAGTHTRLSPQLTFYRGPFGLLTEHLSSEQEVSINGVAQTFEHTAWQAAASWVLTGEDASYKGIKPAAPYAGGAAGWGAFELALRHGVLDVDDGVFPAYADPTASVSEATSTGIALHWHLDSNVRTSLDYQATGFEGGAAGGDRRDEKALFARLQVAF